nr:flagellar basal body P-ring formation chaperone FlgA [Desulfurobacterium thermolithotrophum]
MKCLELLERLSLKYLIILLFFPFSVTFAAEVIVKRQAELDKDKITVADIAEIHGSSIEKEVISAITISSSPSPCKEKRITKEQIAKKIAEFLRNNDVSFKEIKISGFPFCKVKRICLIMKSEDIKDRIRSFFRENYPDVEILSIFVPKIVIPFREYKDSIEIEDIGNHYARVVYSIFSKGNLIKKLWITVKIDRKRKATVAVKDIPKGKLITYSDVKIEKVPSKKARKSAISLNEVIGKIAKRDIRKGEVIKITDLSPNYVVWRNKPVKIIYDIHNIHIELLGIALENGAIGDIIRIKNISTGKVLICKVIGNGIVKFVYK